MVKYFLWWLRFWEPVSKQPVYLFMVGSRWSFILPVNSCLWTVEWAFGNCLIILHGNSEWRFCPPKRTPCDFFLWGYLKNKVFTTLPENLQTLQQRIVDEYDLFKFVSTIFYFLPNDSLSKTMKKLLLWVKVLLWPTNADFVQKCWHQ